MCGEEKKRRDWFNIDVDYPANKARSMGHLYDNSCRHSHSELYLSFIYVCAIVTAHF